MPPTSDAASSTSTLPPRREAKIAAVIPTEQMPHDVNGRPFELLCNPTGIISRTNPSQVFEAVLGKIAEKRAAGVDVISLGIGDPDRPTPPLIVEAIRRIADESSVSSLFD